MPPQLGACPLHVEGDVHQALSASMWGLVPPQHMVQAAATAQLFWVCSSCAPPGRLKKLSRPKMAACGQHSTKLCRRHRITLPPDSIRGCSQWGWHCKQEAKMRQQPEKRQQSVLHRAPTRLPAATMPLPKWSAKYSARLLQHNKSAQDACNSSSVLEAVTQGQHRIIRSTSCICQRKRNEAGHAVEHSLVDGQLHTKAIAICEQQDPGAVVPVERWNTCRTGIFAQPQRMYQAE
jgi:hypothetical protein